MIPWASPFMVLIDSTFKCRATICLFRDFKLITGCHEPSAFKTRNMGLRKDTSLWMGTIGTGLLIVWNFRQ